MATMIMGLAADTSQLRDLLAEITERCAALPEDDERVRRAQAFAEGDSADIVEVGEPRFEVGRVIVPLCPTPEFQALIDDLRRE